MEDGVGRCERVVREDDFAQAVAGEIPGLYRYGLSLVGKAVEAEDLVSNTVVRALEHRDQFRGEAALRTWLHRILYHLAIDHTRHQSHEVVLDDIEEVEALWSDEAYSVDATEVFERAESHAQLADALEHLGFGYRAVVVLHDVEGWTVAAIAEALDLELPAAKQRLRRGRMMLVSALARGGDVKMANRSVPLHCATARAEVSDYIDGELDLADRHLLEAHLAKCATCPPLYQALVGVKTSLGSLRDSDSVISPELARRVRERLGPRAFSASQTP